MLLLLLACAEDPTPAPVDTDPVEPVVEATWRGGVRDLVDQRCGPCHTGNGFGGLLIRNRGDLVDVPSSIGMPQIDPGDVENSYVWHKVVDTHEEVGGDGERMPLDLAPLTEDELALLEDWIEAGAPLE